MTLEDIAEFELDMARFDLDASMEFDEVNRILREIYLDKLVEQSEMLQFYNIWQLFESVLLLACYEKPLGYTRSRAQN